MIAEQVDYAALEGHELRGHLDSVRLRYGVGEIGRETARELSAPILAEMNRRGKEIAKRYNKRYSPITFTGAMR